MAPRTIAIGDIHGCRTSLDTLLDVIGPNADDRLVFLGDYVDRGPDSRGVVETLIALDRACDVITILGNHEELMLAATGGVIMGRLWYANGAFTTLASYGHDFAIEDIPREHIAFLQSCVPYYETDKHLFVHAGYEAELPMEEQPFQTLRWQRLDLPAARPHCSGKPVILGHSPQFDGHVLDLGFLKCIDTFCFGGQWLTGLDVDTGTVWQANEQGRSRQYVLGTEAFV